MGGGHYVGGNELELIFKILSVTRQEAKSKKKSSVRIDYVEEALIESINFKKLEAEFKTALDIFHDNFLYKGFTGRITENYPFRTKDSFFMILDKEEDDKEEEDDAFMTIVSTEKKGLENLRSLLLALGKVSEDKLVPIFSPEERIYLPYFYFLGTVTDLVFDEQNIKTLIEKSINEYSDDNFLYAISNIGLVAEEYLTIIHETLFREKIRKSTTLGEVYENISKKVKNYYHGKNPKSRNFSTTRVYSELKKMIEKKRVLNKEIAQAVMLLMNYHEEEKKLMNKSIRQIRSKNNISVFPENIRLNINELINYRNAVSHKTKIPIGYFEALKAVYCCFTIIDWWNNLLNEIDWDVSKEEILLDVVRRKINADNEN